VTMTVPDNFTFADITAGQTSPNIYIPNINDALVVEDTRGGSGFTVTAQASAFNGSTGGFIPLQIFKVATSNFSTNPSDANVSAPTNTEDPNINSNYTANFGNDQNAGSPILILDGTTGPHNTTASANVNYLIDYSGLNPAPQPGIYTTTVTFTLNPNP
jgi:hypothetical protein